MPLLAPLNDIACLDKLHDGVREFMATDRARALVSQFVDVHDVVRFIRSLTQRDDLGDPDDGPKLACEVSQRLRLPAVDPNCFERLALFLALALLIEPDLELTSATLMVDEGLHSFPVEIRDGVPHAVVLDPMTTGLGNAMNATAYELRNASPMASDAIAPWFADLAWHACATRGALDCYERALAALRAGLLNGHGIRDREAIDCVLGLAHQDAQLFGARGRAALDRVWRSVRNLSVALDTKRVARFLDTVMDAAEPVAANAIKAALIAKFGPAAQIALQGIDLAVVQDRKRRDELAQADTDDADQDDDETPATRERMRRMTLAFRQPERKDH